VDDSIVGACLLPGIHSIRRYQDVIAGAGQSRCYSPAKARLIVHDQDYELGSRHSSSNACAKIADGKRILIRFFVSCEKACTSRDDTRLVVARKACEDSEMKI
jgi:hypothetical protein